MKIDTLFFGDIDGCLIKGFPAGNLNHAAFMEQLKLQPINQFIMKKIRDFFINHSYDIEENEMVVEFATGRKESEIGQMTSEQMAEINRFITNIHFYDESRAYEPYDLYVVWKIGVLIDLIAFYNPKKLIVLEDSIDIIFAISMLELNCEIEYWFVIKDKFILYSEFVENCILESKPQSRMGV